eukprot:508515-Prymnesium_polylepis.1
MVAAACGAPAAAAAIELLQAGAAADGVMVGQLQAAHLAAWAGCIELLDWLQSGGGGGGGGGGGSLLCAPSRSGLRP